MYPIRSPELGPHHQCHNKDIYWHQTSGQRVLTLWQAEEINSIGSAVIFDSSWHVSKLNYCSFYMCHFFDYVNFPMSFRFIFFVSFFVNCSNATDCCLTYKTILFFFQFHTEQCHFNIYINIKFLVHENLMITKNRGIIFIYFV